MYWEWGYHVCTYHAYVSGTLSSPWQPGSEAGDCVAWLVSASPGTSLSDEALLLPEVQDKCTQAQVLMSSDTTYRPIMFIEPISNLRFLCNSAKVSLVRVLSRILSLGESVCCLQGPGGMPPQKILGSLRLSSKWSVWGMQGKLPSETHLDWTVLVSETHFPTYLHSSHVFSSWYYCNTR